MTLIEKYLQVKTPQISIDGLEKLIGKSIRIIICEIDNKKNTNKRKWKNIGSLDLGGKLDNTNIRDYAYD
jgi:hypothetical protein